MKSSKYYTGLFAVHNGRRPRPSAPGWSGRDQLRSGHARHRRDRARSWACSKFRFPSTMPSSTPPVLRHWTRNGGGRFLPGLAHRRVRHAHHLPLAIAPSRRWSIRSRRSASPRPSRDLPAHHRGAPMSSIAGFGGAFLAMVGLKFSSIRTGDPLDRRGRRRSPSSPTSLARRSRSAFPSDPLRRLDALPAHDAMTYLVSGIFGLLPISPSTPWAGCSAGRRTQRPAWSWRSGLASFPHLEVLDASFSFDGVIGAFALSNNLFIIALASASARVSSAR